MRDDTILWPRMKVTQAWHDDGWDVLARAHVGGPDISVVSVNFFFPRKSEQRSPHFPDYGKELPMPWQPARELEVA